MVNVLWINVEAAKQLIAGTYCAKLLRNIGAVQYT